MPTFCDANHNTNSLEGSDPFLDSTAVSVSTARRAVGRKDTELFCAGLGHSGLEL